MFAQAGHTWLYQAFYRGVLIVEHEHLDNVITAAYAFIDARNKLKAAP